MEGATRALLSVLFAFAAMAAVTESLKVEYSEFDKIPMKSMANLTIRLSFDESTDEEAEWPANRLAVVTFNSTDPTSWAIDMMNNSVSFTFDQIRRRRPKNVLVRGAIIGVDRVELLAHLQARVHKEEFCMQTFY